MKWFGFPEFALTTMILWAFAIILFIISYKKKDGKKPTSAGLILAASGVIVIAVFIIILWTRLERPPLRTLGETRLWYSFFLSIIGIITYFRWKYKWFMIYSLGLSILFLLIDFLNPETYDKALMPALQSPWFIPHVIVYIFAYALLAASSIAGLKGLIESYYGNRHTAINNKIGIGELKITTLFLGDNLVYIGFSFLTLGLIFGALWAKVAWGNYWTWDPKETWAFLTWLCYLIYIHFRHYQPKKVKTPLWLLSIAFIVLLVCWFGINYLPSAQNSVHVYSR